MKQYNHKLQCYIEIDELDVQAAREGHALQFHAKNRINNRHTINKHKPRFIKSKHCI